MKQLRRRAFLEALARTTGGLAGLALLAGCGAAPAAVPSSARVFRVGLLSGTTESGDLQEGRFDEFIARLGELGYREGENLTIERRGVNPFGAEDENRVTAAELVSLQVDVIVVRGGQNIRAAVAATSAVPIVMMLGGFDPVAAGVVESVARPGGNVTGVGGTPPEVELKRLQLLVEAVPGVSKVAVLGNFGNPQFWEPATRLLGVEVFSATPTGFEGGFAAALARAVGQGADALLARNAGASVNPNAALIGELSARYRLPGIFPDRRYVEAGGLITYESRSSDIERRGAEYVDRILRGARPADLPVESPTRYDLIVNMRTARAIGLSFSRDFLAQVDEAIE